MIVRDRPRGPQLLLALRGSILPRISAQLATCTALALAVTLTHGFVYRWKVRLTSVPFSLVGLALAIFLGFRNNAAYDRYWEARKLWGGLVSRARSLARQVQTLPTFDARRVQPRDGAPAAPAFQSIPTHTRIHEPA